MQSTKEILPNTLRLNGLSDDCLPLGAIVTTPGTGSEVSNNAMAVDDRSEPWIKYPLFQSSFRFTFAIMDPQLTYTLPPKQTASGAMDIIFPYNGALFLMGQIGVTFRIECAKRIC